MAVARSIIKREERHLRGLRRPIRNRADLLGRAANANITLAWYRGTQEGLKQAYRAIRKKYPKAAEIIKRRIYEDDIG